MPLVKYYRKALKQVKLNKKNNNDIRVLTNFFLLGIFDYYYSRVELTYSQRRHLCIVCGLKIGFSHNALTTAYDTANVPGYYLPELADLILDALDSGYRTSRVYFEGDQFSTNAIIQTRTCAAKNVNNALFY